MAGKLRNGVLALGALLGVLWLGLELAARASARQIAAAFAPLAVLDYESAGLGWNGRLRLDRPRLRFADPAKAGTITARSAYVAGGGWLWTLWERVAGDGGLPTQASIELHGLQISGLPLAAAVAEWLQPPGLVPFALAGCPGAAPTATEYARLGVRVGERIDRIDYWYEPDHARLELAFELEQADFARLAGSADFNGFRRAVFTDAAARGELRLARGELDYHDRGFLGVRNVLCAGRLGISSMAFVDVHVAAVDAFLAVRGITAGDSLRSLYRRLATEGGTLRLTTLPDPGWVPADIAEYPRADLLRQLSITARHGDALPVMLQLAFADPMAPLAIAGAADARSGVGVTADAALPPAVASEARAAAAETAPAPLATAAPAIPQSAPPPATAAAAVATAADTAADPAATPAAAERLAASAPPPPENSTLALVWKPGVVERLPPRGETRPDYEIVAVSTLRDHIGQRVRLVTAGGKIVDGDLRAIEGGQALLSVRVTAGSAQIAVPLANVREARLVGRRR